MKNDKITVGILFGGQSAEHDISIRSTAALYKNLDREKYDPVFLYLSREDGKWRLLSEQDYITGNYMSGEYFSFLPWNQEHGIVFDADIYFPMLHGPNGEDGRIQALLELAGKPYVGASSLTSGLAMDKIVAKLLFVQAGLNVADFLYFKSNDFDDIAEKIEKKLSYPVFIKPCSMGSSVGISRVGSKEDLKCALDLAFRYDHKILIEKGLDIREIEVSVMGNDDIMVSRPGELIPHNTFYDYNDKYIDGKTSFYMPAPLSWEQEERVRDIAARAYKALFLNGMSRVDLFIEKNTDEIYVNEINTIPGFTEISMFPKLWTLQDISFTNLITRLIDYGFEYWKKQHISTALHEGINQDKCKSK